MNTMQKGVVTLLRSAITGEKLPLPRDFDLDAARGEFKRHGITMLAFEGASNCGLDRKSPAMRQMFLAYCNGMLRSKAQMEQIQRIFDAFGENGIDYMPLKGCNMKGRYPKPELRTMGDADILIRLDQYDRIVPVLENLGFQQERETDHELIWTGENLFLELHKRLIPSYNRDFFAYFGDGWQLGKVRDGAGFSMEPEDELVYLLAHFAKHYRDGGIGCRHVADIWVFLGSFPELDQDRVRRELEKLGLLAFYDHLRRMMDVWFDGGEGDDVTELMTQFIFSSGSWGCAESMNLSLGVRDMGASDSLFRSRLGYVWSRLFPPGYVLREKYPVLKKAPWMLPAVWLVRPVYKLLFEGDSVKEHSDVMLARNREDLERRRAMLHAVGLDYNF